MKLRIPPFLAILLIPATVLAQHGPAPEPAAARSPQFTLPAGQHRLDELIGLLGQIRKTTIRCERDEIALGLGPVALQRELLLDGAAFDDVVTTLLFYRGLIVVPDAAQGLQVIALDDAERLRSAAVGRTAAEILARPGRLEFATTKVPAGKLPMAGRIGVLRALFGMNRVPWAMQMVADGEDMRLTGSTEQLAVALRVLQLLDDTAPTVAPAVAWAGAAPLSWPGGRMTQAAFLQLFANTLDANVLGEVGGGEVDLGAPARLPAAEWFSRATVALDAIDEVIVAAAAPHRVFLLRSKHEARFREVIWRSGFESNEQVAKSTAVRPVLTVYALQHISSAAATNQLRPMLRGLGSSTLVVGTLSPSRLLVGGLRDEVARVIEQLHKVDVAR